MQSPSDRSDPDQEQPQQVCTSCKARKRRCNKGLPKCLFCSKRNLECHYPKLEQNKPPKSSVSDQLWQISATGQDSVNFQPVDFPTMLFLDPALLQNGQLDIFPVPSPVPADILHLIGDMAEIRITAFNYFEHTHWWMPFISKKRFYDIYLHSQYQLHPDVALLLLCLKLITTAPPRSPRNPRTALYYTAKRFYLEVEGSSIFSVRILQAGVLLSLYELGHAIYPAAFLSIGACARYAYALGINGRRTICTKRVITLVEAEERRRIWWAIVILDRFVSVGCPGRPFATAHPEMDDLLPAEDTAWDQGIVRPEDSFTLSSPMTGHMSKFALLCQAARLLGQVLEHISSDSELQNDVSEQLDRTLHSMLAAALDVEFPDYNQITFVYSALAALHAPWLNSGRRVNADTERSRRARTVTQEMSDTIYRNILTDQCFFGRDPEDMPPWGLFFAYHIYSAHMRAVLEPPTQAVVVKNLRKIFLEIDVKWNAAGTYLQLLETQEAMNYG